MTSRPSAFDALMSNERLLAAKKNPSAPSPTKKPKSLLSSRPPAKYQGNAIDGLENSIEDSPKPNSNETQKPPDSKKTKVVGISERTAELKAKIGFLKKKPADFDPKTAAKIVKQVFSVLPVYDKVVPALLTSGIWNLPKTCSFTVGVPVEPMKAKSTNSVAKIVNKFQDADIVCEYKYDGERAQILSTRARKNVLLSDIKVDVCIFAFDILYLNGQALLQEQLEIRKEIGDTLDLVPVAAFHGKRTGFCP